MSGLSKAMMKLKTEQMHLEERVSMLEEVALILRAKVEPETLTANARARAQGLRMRY